jgi:hypothetical protein
MSEADWIMTETKLEFDHPEDWGRPPKRERVLRAGERMTLSNTSVEVVWALSPAPPATTMSVAISITTMSISPTPHYGWADLAQRIPMRSFSSDPSIPSSLTFPRKMPWDREKAESLYLFMLRDVRRTSAPRAPG